MLTEGIWAELEEKSVLISHGSHTGSGPDTTRGLNIGPGTNPLKKRPRVIIARNRVILRNFVRRSIRNQQIGGQKEQKPWVSG